MTDKHEVLTFIENAEDDGVVDEHALVSVATELELDEDELATVRAELEARGVELVASDEGAVHCGRHSGAPSGGRRRRDQRLDHALHERDREAPAAHRGRGGRAREADRAGRQGREGADDQLEPAPRRLDREALPRSRSAVRRPHPGGLHRPQPCGREVRLAEGIQVLDVRDLVDPTGVSARRVESVADDSCSRPRARAAHEAGSARTSVRGRSTAARRRSRSSRK